MALGFGSKRQSLVLIAVFTILLMTLFYHHNDLPDVPRLSDFKAVLPSDRLSIRPPSVTELQNIHLLLPAPSGAASLCKTLLTASVLGYPIPTLISYNQTFTDENLIGGGRHLAKIDRTLEWLDAQDQSKDNDLVVIVDAYGGFNYYSDPEAIDSHLEGDVWFQLPRDVLVQRYHAVTERANRDLMANLGKAYDRESIRQRILFGASKQCTPSDHESSACYPVPESPLPSDLYGRFTDAAWSNHTTQRPRYLSSAYMMGPVADMRVMYRRASEKANMMRSLIAEVAAKQGTDPAHSLELGSDQAVFSHMFGEQEYQREAIRRRHGEKPRPKSLVEGSVVNDALDPSFPHEVLSEKDGHPDEFGMHVDYWSDLGMQTAHSEDDARWLMYNRPVRGQLMASHAAHHPWSCHPRASGRLPIEVLNSTGLPRAAVPDDAPFRPLRGWDEIPLYTNICLDTIPVIVNHAGDRSERERDWPEMWLQPHARRLIEQIVERRDSHSHAVTPGGAFDGPDGVYKSWWDLCPVTLENELYRDYYDGEV